MINNKKKSKGIILLILFFFIMFFSAFLWADEMFITYDPRTGIGTLLDSQNNIITELGGSTLEQYLATAKILSTNVNGTITATVDLDPNIFIDTNPEEVKSEYTIEDGIINLWYEVTSVLENKTIQQFRITSISTFIPMEDVFDVFQPTGWSYELQKIYAPSGVDPEYFNSILWYNFNDPLEFAQNAFFKFSISEIGYEPDDAFWTTYFGSSLHSDRHSEATALFPLPVEVVDPPATLVPEPTTILMFLVGGFLSIFGIKFKK